MRRPLEQGERWLRKKLKALDGVSVVYSRDNRTVEVTATKGMRRSAVGENSGLVLAQQMLDFLIDRSELILDGDRVTPQLNDRITLTENGRTEEYRVSSGPAGEDCYEFSDRNHELYRIHTTHQRTICS